MHSKFARLILGTGAALVLWCWPPPDSIAWAGGTLPSEEVCNDKNNPPQDAVTRGGCVVLHRRKGNCTACHVLPGASAYGNVAPPLISMSQRFPDRARLRAQLADPRQSNPNTVMPPFGAHGILTPEEIDQVVEFLYTL